MFESRVWKNGHSRYISRNIFMPSCGRAASQALTAVPNPYQPGNMSRHCDQPKTQGIARRSSMRVEFLRDAGRLPIFRLAISPITVESQKYRSKPAVSYTRFRYARYAWLEISSMAAKYCSGGA